MRRLKLVTRPPELGPLIIRYPLLHRAVALGLFAYGLLTLSSDFGHIRGECCTPRYYNYYPSIEFTAVWVGLVGLIVLNAYRKLVLIDSVVRVSTLGGMFGRRFPVESVTVSIGEAEDRSGEKTEFVPLRLGRFPVTVSADFDGYEQLRLSLYEVGEST